MSDFSPRDEKAKEIPQEASRAGLFGGDLTRMKTMQGAV